MIINCSGFLRTLTSQEYEQYKEYLEAIAKFEELENFKFEELYKNELPSISIHDYVSKRLKFMEI